MRGKVHDHRGDGCGDPSTISAPRYGGPSLRAGTSTAITARLQAERPPVHRTEWVSRYTSRSKNSAPLVTLMPIILAIWLSRDVGGQAADEADQDRLDSSSAKPQPEHRQATNIRPPTIAWAAAIAAYCSVPDAWPPDSAEPTSAARRRPGGHQVPRRCQQCERHRRQHQGVEAGGRRQARDLVRSRCSTAARWPVA